ncbi:3-dehydroquinate synthase [Sesbania bispinosa]|nr:3-dehydroquinate synthase [Sesbania bispinosa]
MCLLDIAERSESSRDVAQRRSSWTSQGHCVCRETLLHGELLHGDAVARRIVLVAETALRGGDPLSAGDVVVRRRCCTEKMLLRGEVASVEKMLLHGDALSAGRRCFTKMLLHEDAAAEKSEESEGRRRPERVKEEDVVVRAAVGRRRWDSTVAQRLGTLSISQLRVTRESDEIRERVALILIF